MIMITMTDIILPIVRFSTHFVRGEAVTIASSVRRRRTKFLKKLIAPIFFSLLSEAGVEFFAGSRSYSGCSERLLRHTPV